MPISSISNEQNIGRVPTKMSDNFPGQNNTKLSNSAGPVNYFGKKDNKDGENHDDLNLPYDHMYASNTENGEIGLTSEGVESEVKFWKEWLILHLDLIQQQSDEILNKERTILILQQENEMLKERISCMERGAPFQPSKFYTTASFLDDMTQDSAPCDEDNKNCLDLINLNFHNGEKRAPFVHDGGCQTQGSAVERKFLSDPQSEVMNCNNSIADFNFSVNNSSELDPMRNLRMNIRKKRLSNSSAVSTNDPNNEEKRFQRFKNRRKRIVKDSQVVMTADQYVTEASETNLKIVGVHDVPGEIPNIANLEVPRWRVKVYASCYAMEGTENLDDEVYNKRHSRLENDERRRKRWDVQRIREQRVIEKLKQRQERMGSGSRTDESGERVHSLWPKLEDIKFLEVSDQLPVSAFGCPIPKISPTEFSLPWITNPSIVVTKKVPTRRSANRRKLSKR